MKKIYIVVILLFILCGCSIYDKELKIDYEAIKEKKPYYIEEGSEIQNEETLIHNENTVVNQMEKPYDNEIKNYQDYSGFWTEGGISHEEILQNGGVELYIEIINNNELHGYLTLDKILNLLHRRSVAHSLASFGDSLRDFLNLRSCHAAGFRDTVVRLRNRISDFFGLEDNLSAVSFNDGHVAIPLWKNIILE